MLVLKDLCFKRDNKKILDNVNLTLEENKFYVITGKNGSGKSTLAKIIMGILKPDSGKIILNGKDITETSVTERAKMGIGFAFQQPVKFKGITVFDLLKISKTKEMTRKEACSILSRVGLCALEYVDREVNASLSGGELKRIEIATLIAKKPVISIFDEPEAGIDLWSFQSLIKVFKEIESANLGITLVISHQEKILSIADEIILMNEGKIIKMAQKENILKDILKEDKCPKGVDFCG